MQTFKYKAAKSDGSSYEASGSFADKAALYKELKKNNEVILSVKEVRPGTAFLSLDIGLLLHYVPMQEKIGFARNLGSMIEAGLSVNRSLTVIVRQTKSSAFKKIVESIIEEVNKGKELSFALQSFPKIFPPLVVSMVRSGEASGTIADSLKMVSTQMENSYQLKKKVRGAMLYPMIILCLILTVAILMLIYVVPTLASVFADLNSDLPFSTRAIIGTSDFIQHNWIISFSILVALVLGFVFGKRTKFGGRTIEWIFLHMPFINELGKEINSARTARTLAALLSSGVEIVMAMEITEDVVQNSYYKAVIEKAKNEIQKGNPISQVFAAHEKLYPPFVGEMISVGEETGKLGEMLNSLATFYETEVEQKTKNLSTIIEPLLMIFIGTAVGFFAYSMLTPIYSVIGKIQ